ncbi:MAG: PKD domain-containing protein [Deltaproteobacteria bacterium]|nr:PKD domain-containing protein [Deltaproteobacteria bacterium]
MEMKKVCFVIVFLMVVGSSVWAGAAVVNLNGDSFFIRNDSNHTVQYNNGVAHLEIAYDSQTYDWVHYTYNSTFSPTEDFTVTLDFANFYYSNSADTRVQVGLKWDSGVTKIQKDCSGFMAWLHPTYPAVHRVNVGDAAGTLVFEKQGNQVRFYVEGYEDQPWVFSNLNFDSPLTLEIDVGTEGTSLFKVDLSNLNIISTVPDAQFKAESMVGAAPFTARFKDLSTGDIQGRNWGFGDGKSTSLRCPDHTYAVPGSYTVSLTTSGPSGTDTMSVPEYIRVLPEGATFYYAHEWGQDDATDQDYSAVLKVGFDHAGSGAGEVVIDSHSDSGSFPYTYTLVNGLLSIAAGPSNLNFYMAPDGETLVGLTAKTAGGTDEIIRFCVQESDLSNLSGVFYVCEWGQGDLPGDPDFTSLLRVDFDGNGNVTVQIVEDSEGDSGTISGTYTVYKGGLTVFIPGEEDKRFRISPDGEKIAGVCAKEGGSPYEIIRVGVRESDVSNLSGTFMMIEYGQEDVGGNPDYVSRIMATFDGAGGFSVEILEDSEGGIATLTGAYTVSNGWINATIDGESTPMQFRVSPDGNTMVGIIAKPGGNPLESIRFGVRHSERSDFPIPSATLSGDLNGDGKVDLSDSVIAAQVLAGNDVQGIRPDYAASGIDINMDNRIGFAEQIFPLQVAAEKRESVPANSFSASDLAGTWFLAGSDIQGDHTWDGSIIINSSGVVLSGGALNSSAGSSYTFSGGSLSISRDGRVSGTVSYSDGVDIQMTLQMNPTKGIIVGEGNATGYEDGLFVLVRPGTGFTAADLQGEWFIGGSNIQGLHTWDGVIVVTASGAILPGGTLTSSSGGSYTITGGSLSITAAGGITGAMTDSTGTVTNFTMHMNREKDLLAGEGNTSRNEDGLFFFVKKSNGFILSDLKGKWALAGSDLQGNHTWNGGMGINESGKISGGILESSACPVHDIAGGILAVAPDGKVTGTMIEGDGHITAVTLQVDANRQIMVGEGNGAGNEDGLFVFVRR